MNTRKLGLGNRNLVGRRVTEARRALGITQVQLLARLQVRGVDISGTSLSLLEGQKRPVFDYELAALADILKVDVNWLLGRQELSRRTRLLIYLGGVAGYAVHLVGNLLYARPEQNYLPFESGYAFPHYLIAAALFVWVRTFFSCHAQALRPAQKPLRLCAQVVFGVYWVHPLVLDVITHLQPDALPLAAALVLQGVLTALLSFLFAACVSRIPLLRRLLQG